MDATGAVLKSIRLDLSEADQRALRVRAANHNMSMSAYVRKLIADDLATPQPPSKKKGARRDEEGGGK